MISQLTALISSSEMGVEISGAVENTRAGSPLPSPSLAKKMLKYSETAGVKSSLATSFSRVSLSSDSSNSSSESMDVWPLCYDGSRSRSASHSTDPIPTLKPLRVDTALKSPECFGSLIGSYEESIMSGRMSTFPSKPIAFLCDIGVVADHSKRKKLQCPPHLLLEFTARFYELEGERMPSTPYVGSLDVDWRQVTTPTSAVSLDSVNTLSSISLSSSSLSPSLNSESLSPSFNSESLSPSLNSDPSPSLNNESLSGPGEMTPMRHSPNNESPPMAMTRLNTDIQYQSELHGYKIPPKGQLQIIIKNPSKTAIKVFLVPYDFKDMPKNTKTFLRQKSYAVSTSLDTLKPILTSKLRYAVHLQFQCFKSGLYLTKLNRIVFSQRALESDETLRVVVDRPTDPVYSCLYDNQDDLVAVKPVPPQKSSILEEGCR